MAYKQRHRRKRYNLKLIAQDMMDRGLNQRAMGDLIGRTESSMSKFMSGDRASEEMLFLIATELNKPVSRYTRREHK